MKGRPAGARLERDVLPSRWIGKIALAAYKSLTCQPTCAAWALTGPGPNFYPSSYSQDKKQLLRNHWQREQTATYSFCGHAVHKYHLSTSIQQ